MKVLAFCKGRYVISPGQVAESLALTRQTKTLKVSTLKVNLSRMASVQLNIMESFKIMEVTALFRKTATFMKIWKKFLNQIFFSRYLKEHIKVQKIFADLF